MQLRSNIVTVCSIVVLFSGCVVYHRGPETDHFDGVKFHNVHASDKNRLGRLLAFLTTRSPAPWPQWIAYTYAGHLPTSVPAGQAAITFINHATCLIQLADLTLLTDPVYAHRVGPWGLMGPKRVHPPGVPFAQLPPIDVVLISHDHYDHFDAETLKKLQTAWDPVFVTGLGNQKRLQALGIHKVATLDWWETYEHDVGLKVTFTPAQHFSGRGVFDHDHTLWGSFVLEVGDLKLYFAGDTAYSPHFKAIAARFGPIDFAMLPIGSYQPRWFMQPIHADPGEAVQAHLDLQARQSIGIHFGTFALSDEARDQPALDLRAAQAKLCVAEECFAVPELGQTFWIIHGAHVSVAAQ
ncbi:MAG: MBL fold metallo-hydrolase [Bacteroidota bacterium]